MLDRIHIGYLGVGRCLPRNILTNKHLEQIVDTSDEWITQRTGIRTRHVVSSDESALSLATNAAKNALDHAGIKASQISTIRIGVNTHLRFPSLATMVQNELGIKNASASDIGAGCAGFIFSVEDIYNGIMTDWTLTRRKSYGLAIGVDVLSKVTDWNDRSTCVLFGDGAGAAVIGPVESTESGEILAVYTRTQGQYCDLLLLDEFLSCPLEDPETMLMNRRNETNYPFLRMEGRRVFAVAVRTMISDIRSVIDKNNRMNGNTQLTVKDIKYVIPHQANLRIVKAVQEGLKLTVDQVHRDGVINFGNTSAASIPIAYPDEWGKRPNILEVDVAFGAGFASGAILWRTPSQW